MKKTFFAIAALVVAFQVSAAACGIEGGSGHAEGEETTQEKA